MLPSRAREAILGDIVELRLSSGDAVVDVAQVVQHTDLPPGLGAVVYTCAAEPAQRPEGAVVRVNLAWNPYLFGSLVLLGFWGIGFAITRRRGRGRPDTMREFWWASFACALLGVTEPLFVPEYWSPPSVFQVGRWDFESFVFCFACGGITAAFPEVPAARRFFTRLGNQLADLLETISRAILSFVTQGALASRQVPREPDAPATRSEIAQDNLILAAVFLGALGTTAHLGLNIIYDTSLVCVAMAMLIAWWRPMLRWQILSGGFTFTLVYAITLRLVGAYSPTFYTDYWNLPALSNIWILGAPAEEYLFALTLGLFWAPLYETWKHVQTAPN